MLIEAKSKLIMIGDSVTDCGRAQPVGEGLFDAIGNGYVRMVDALLLTGYPDLAIRVINMGNSGNTSRDLLGRWQIDVIDQKPDWVSIMIGFNDVWRQYDLPRQPETHVYLEEYETNLDKMVSQTLPLVKGVILITPFYMEPNRSDAMRSTMDQYSAAVARQAAKHGCFLVNTQKYIDDILGYMHPNAISWDRIHPNHIGHMLIARAFLKAIELEY